MIRKLTCRGDNNWEKDFSSKEDMLNFMFSLVGKVFTHFNSDGDAEDYLFCFDVEDDCITLVDIDGKLKYCAGWHWPEEQTAPQIMATEKTSFYELFMKLEM